MTAIPRRFYITAAICSMLSAGTTLLLIFSPSFYADVPEGLAGRMLGVTDPAYQLRAWAYFVHPFLTFTAALGVAVACRRAAPGWRATRRSGQPWIFGSPSASCSRADRRVAAQGGG